MSIASELHDLKVSAQVTNNFLAGIEQLLTSIDESLDRIADTLAPEPADITLNFRENLDMASVVVKMQADKGGMRAAGDPVRWSAASQAGGLLFQVLDEFGNEIPNPAITDITTTLGSDNNALVSIAKADEFTYTLHKEQTPPTPVVTVTFSGHLAYNDGSFGPFTATQPIILDVAAPADLKLKFIQA